MRKKKSQTAAKRKKNPTTAPKKKAVVTRNQISHPYRTAAKTTEAQTFPIAAQIETVKY